MELVYLGPEKNLKYADFVQTSDISPNDKWKQVPYPFFNPTLEYAYSSKPAFLTFKAHEIRNLSYVSRHKSHINLNLRSFNNN